MPTHHQGSKQERASLDAYIKLVRCSDALSARLQPALDSEGLTGSQFGVLEALLHLGPMSLSDLAAKILRSGGNLTLVARNLEKRGLVKRTQDAQDRRVHLLALTSKGARLVRDVFNRHLARLVREMSALEPAEQKELARLCKKLGQGPA